MANRKKPGLEKLIRQPQTAPAAAAPAAQPVAQNVTTGNYYSPREYHTQSGSLGATVSQRRSAMEQQAAALRERQQTMENLRTEAEKQRERYYSLKGKFVGDSAAEYEQRVLDDWTRATRAYVESNEAYGKAYNAYKPYEDAYNQAVTAYNDYNAQEDAAYDQWRSTVRDADTIRAERAEIEKLRQELRRRMVDSNYYANDALYMPAHEAAENEARIQELQAYLGGIGGREKLLEEELEWSEKLRWEDLRQNADFEQKSEYKRGFSDPVDDHLYNWINTHGGKQPQNAMHSAEGPIEKYRYMNADQIAMYNYLYYVEGAEGARAYLDYLEPELNERRNNVETHALGAWAREHPVRATAATIAMSPVSGVVSRASQIAAKLMGEEIYPDAGYNMLSNQKNAIRESVAAKIEQSLGEFWGPVGSFGSNVGMSMADMLADKWSGIGLAGGKDGAKKVINALLGSRVVAETVIDGRNQGLSDGQAISLGFANAAAELLTERIGLDELLKLPDGWQDAGFWKGALRGAAGEAGEEGLTNLANLVADIGIAGEKSEFSQNVAGYKEAGESDEKALLLALKDAGINLALDALGGGISGAAFGGVQGFRGKRAANAQQKADNAANMAADSKIEQDAHLPGPEDYPGGKDAGGNAYPGGYEAWLDDAKEDGLVVEAEPGAKRLPRDVTDDVENVTLEEARQAAINRRNPLLSGVMHSVQSEQEIARLKKAETLAQVTGIDLGVDDARIEQADRLSKVLGREIFFFSENPTENGIARGYYSKKTGRIGVNAKSQQLIAVTVGHELTHSVEIAGSYSKLKDIVFERIADSGGNLEAMRREREALYRKNDKVLKTAEEIDREIVAKYVEDHLLTDEESIRKLVRDDRSVARRILDWLDGLLAKLGNRESQERKFVREARDVYRAALAEADMKRDRRNKRREMLSAYAKNNDAAGDAAFDKLYSSGEGMLSELQDDDDDPYDPSHDDKIPFSFGGENAANVDREALTRAKAMQESGEPMTKIFRETGWYVGADGKWRFEIDDSGMRYRRGGDARFRRDHPEYARFRELERKFIDCTITDAEITEMAELRSIWGSEPKRLAERVVRGNAWLSDVLEHDTLYEQYPRLKRVRVRFGDTDDAGGWWDRERNEIVLSERYRQADPAFLELTILHEIQHAIQDIEGFAGGSNPEYWEEIQNSDRAIRENDRALAEAERDVKAALEGIPPEVKKDFWYAANMVDTDPEGAQELRDRLDESEYADAFWDYDWAISTVRELLEQDNPKRTAKDLYRNTAGEIEARDAANRRGLDAGTRKKRLPDTGDERTVFVEGDGRQYSIAPISGDNGEYGDGVILDATIFDGVKPRYWNKVVADFIYNKMAGAELTMYDEAGNPETVYLARLNDRVTKDGAKNSHKVLGKLAEVKAGNVNALATVHLSELLAASHYEDTTDDHSHQWLDENGWEIRYAYMQDKGGNIYRACLNIANGRRGKILYAINKVHKVDEKRTAGGNVPSTENGRGLHTSHSSLEDSVPDSERDVKQYSIGAPDEMTDTERAEVDELLNRADAEADSVAGRGAWEGIDRAEITGKAREHLEGSERQLAAKIAAALDVPRQAKREFLKPIVEELTTEYMTHGTISQEVRDRLFETAWEQGRVVDQEFYDTYKEVKDYLRTTGVTLSETDRDSRDWNEFRKRAFGTVKIVNEGGLPVDTAWGELREMAPALFPEDILNPEDMLRHMVEVGQSIRKVEKTLDEHYGSDAKYAKQMTRNDFDAAIADEIRSLWEVKRYADERKAESAAVTAEDGEELTAEAVMALYPKLKDARKAAEKAVARNLLTKHDKEQVQRLLRHDIQPEHLDPSRDNVKGIMAVYEAKKAFEEAAEPIRKWNRQRKAGLYAQAEELISGAGRIKDKKRGILYSRETMERNIRDIVKNKEAAERIIGTYFKPVHQGAAAAVRMKNQYRERVRKLGLSRKVEKGNTVSEAYAVQFYGEVSDILRLMEQSKFRLKHRDGKSYLEWKAELQKLWEENPNLDQEKVKAAAREFGKIYEELFAQMNEVRVRNGYEPINHRSGYFPHFQQDGRDGILGQFGKALGIDVEVQQLPTTINGLTHTFKPGIRWFGNALERKGFDTAYDAVEGFDRYIEGVADVVHQTDNIQRLRALANQLRYRTSDEGLREQIRKIQERTDLNDEKKDALIREKTKDGKFELSNFVVELDEYTNLLANKKSRADRNMEQAMGRDMYNIVKSLEGRVAANMVAINPGSWLTNFIPITQGWACLDTRHLLGGLKDTLAAMKNDDGMMDRSDFLTGRKGTDALVKTWAQEWSGKLSSPMEWIDTFTAGSLIRGRYRQNLTLGLSEAEALREADEWTAGVMADRSKGSMPTLFHRSNPLTKLFTQFQLEVNNQLSYVWKDIPREKRDKGKKALALALLKFAVGAWLYNWLYEWAFGRRPALDPIDMLTGTVADVMDEETDLADALMNLGGKVAENTPFVGGLLGGGRVPISSALPDVGDLVNAVGNSDWSAGKRLGTATKELAKPAVYMLPPFGGGQIKKVWEGLKMIAQGGSYTLDKDGHPILQYPLHSTDSGVMKALEATQAMVFGKTTIHSGREWVNGGFGNLTAEQTATYKALIDMGVEQSDAFELLTELREAEKSNEQSRAAVQRDILRQSGLDGDAFGTVYYDLLASSDREKEMLEQLLDSDADMGKAANTIMDIKDAATANDRRNAIMASGLTEDQKRMIYRTMISENWGYDVAIEAGLDDETAYDLVQDLGALKPPEGKASVQQIQKWRVAIDHSINENNQLKLLKAAGMNDTSYAKCEALWKIGVAPGAYVRAKELESQFDSDESGSLNGKEWKNLIDGMTTWGIVLPGDNTKYSLTQDQKGFLWQMLTGSKSTKNNPYSAKGGQMWLDEKEKMKEG